MFEITDDFLAQAGYGALPQEYKEQLRQRVTKDVDKKIRLGITIAVGESRADEFTSLLDSTEDVPMVLKWCQDNQIDLAAIVQGAMNEAMVELQQLHNDAMRMVQG